MNQHRNDPKSLVMLVSSMLIFGTIGIFRRMIPMSSEMIALMRGIIGCAFLLMVVQLRRKKSEGSRSGIDRKLMIKLLISGIIVGFNWILLFEAYTWTTVPVATLCLYLQPILVIGASSFLFHEPMTKRKAICSLTALIGMVLVSGVAEHGIPGPNDLKGILFGIGAACFYAATALMNKTMQGIDPYEKTMIQLGVAAVSLIPYVWMTGGYAGNTWTLGTVALLIVVGVVHTGISYSLFFGSLHGLKTQTVAMFSYIDPVFALILAGVILKEQLTGMSLFGAVLILGSAVVCEIKR